MRVIGTAVALVLATASVASAASRFDLDCSGSQAESVGGAGMPWRMRFKVDLASQTFCMTDCSAVHSIQSVTPEEIIFFDGASDGIAADLKVNRATAKLRSVSFGGR